MHLPLRSPARLGAHPDAGLPGAVQPGGGAAAQGERAGGRQASAPGAAAGLEGERREGAEI